MNKKCYRNTYKRILSLVLCTVLILSCLTVPKVATAAGTNYVTPITTYADPSDTTTWNVLWVIVETSKATSKDGKSLEGTPISSENIDKLKNIVIKNFEDYIYEYSQHYMKISSTVLTFDSMEASQNDSYGYIMSDADVKQKLIENGTDITQYDQVTCIWQAKNYTDSSKEIATKGFWGLGGPRMDGTNLGFTQIILLTEDLSENGNLSNNWKDENGKLTAHYCDVYVHEFMHCLQFWVNNFYPTFIARAMPNPDGYETYYAKGTNDLMEDFYKDFFRGNVPTSKGSTNTFGMAIEDYKRKPTSVTKATVNDCTISNLEEWNDLVIATYYGADTKNCKVTLSANIDATGQTIGSINNFKGQIDGNGYAIIGANLKSGLIVTLESGASVKNLTLINARVVTSSINQAVLVGQNHGTITNCGATGKMSCTTQCGGIVGANESDGIIKNCFNGVNIAGSGGYVAGIAGYNGGTVSNCYNFGKVKSSDGGAAVTLFGATSCYALTNSCANEDGDGTTFYSETELKSDEFLTKLDNNQGIWKKGEGYPQFSNAKYDLNDYVIEPTVTVWVNGISTYSKEKIESTLNATSYQDSRGITRQGKLVYLVKNEPTVIEFNTSRHTVVTKTDTTLLSVSTTGTITAKKAGTAYVYVIDTGSLNYEEIAVEIKNAPSKMTLTKVAGSKIKTDSASSIAVQAGSTSDKVYINNYLSRNIIEMDDMEYSITTTADGDLSVSEVQQDENGYYITVNALKSVTPGKVTKRYVTVTNTQTNKKVKMTVYIVDNVGSVTATVDTKLEQVAYVDLSISTMGGNTITTASLKVYVSAEEPTVEGTKVTVDPSKVVSASYSTKTNKIKLVAKGNIISDLGIYIVNTDRYKKEATIIKVGTISADGTITSK